MILIDQIEADRLRGVPAWDAIVEAAVRRFRPIVPTAVAVLAVIPLSRSVFWGANGRCHHGRADSGNGADLVGIARDVRGVLSRQTPRTGGHARKMIGANLRQGYFRG